MNFIRSPDAIILIQIQSEFECSYSFITKIGIIVPSLVIFFKIITTACVNESAKILDFKAKQAYTTFNKPSPLKEAGSSAKIQIHQFRLSLIYYHLAEMHQ